MGLLAIAQAAARIGFAVAGDVKRQITVRSGGTSTHDKTTDVSAVVWAHTWTGQAVIYDEEEREAQAEGGPKLRLKSVLLQASELDFEPTEEGQIQDGSRIYEIADVGSDPAKAIWMITLKR